MSKLTDIKYRIDQLDGGKFQNLCDIYLTCRGYGNGYSLGMKTGTNKTAKGSPDTYFLTPNGKYVFVMYTTQKDNIFTKAIEDFSKCFNANKTGLQPKSVSEIVYCHTCQRLTAGEHEQLHDFCKQRDAALTLIGLDELGNDLYLKYPRLAKDFLGISVNTGQVLTKDEFISVHDSNRLSAPLNTDFLLREEELRLANEKLALNDILILSGPAGVGKTKLALQICEVLAEQNTLEVVCIKSNGLELYEDLLTTFEPEKDYLVFVDDANELSGLHFVLEHFKKVTNEKKYIKKIIMTVRDYARKQVVDAIHEVEKPQILRIGMFKDDEIRKLIKSAYGITNHWYLDRIVAIADGNARLAMLAGKIASETEDLDSIRDVTELYDHYYRKQLDVIIENPSCLISAGIMAFFETLHLDHLGSLEPIFAAAKLSEDQFVMDLKTLHELEIVDLCHDKAAKISDQSFSNYLIKYVFVDKKNISLFEMIKVCFFINKAKTITACNILLNVFSDETTQDFVRQQIKNVWDSLADDEEHFYPFFKSFFYVRPTESLIILRDMIASETFCEFDIDTILNNKAENETSITDDIICMLCGYKNHTLLPEAIDLLLCYYQKRPDLFSELYSALVFHFGVDKDSYYFAYVVQKTVVDKIITMVEKDASPQNVLLFIRVAEKMLRLSFSSLESGRDDTVTYYTIPLKAHEVVLQYRKLLWEELFEIYKRGTYCREIEYLLLECCNPYGDNLDYAVISADMDSINSFFGIFSPECLLHCVIAEHIKDVAEHIEYPYDNVLSPFLESQKYKIYHMLNMNRCERNNMGYTEFKEYQKTEIKTCIKQYSISDFHYLLTVCRECLESVDRNAQCLGVGLDCAIEAFSYNQDLYIEAVRAYLSADTPYDIHPHTVLCKLFSFMSAEDVEALIESIEFSRKNIWLWSFFAEMPVEQITSVWVKKLLDYFEHIPQNLQSSPFRPLYELEKYEKIDANVILKACKIITAHYDESPFVFSLYFSLMMNFAYAESGNMIKKFERDIHLFEDIYLKCVKYSEHDDNDGLILAKIIKQDSDFLYNYLDEMLTNDSRKYRGYDKWAKRLSGLWMDDSYLRYMDCISEYIIDKDGADSWTYNSVMEQLLLHKTNPDAVAERQNKWIFDTIEKYHKDQQRMSGLFAAISEQSSFVRKIALEKFLGLNSDFSHFESIQLEASHWEGWGSLIPCIEERIDYLTSILPLLSGIDYLNHKQKVEQDIESLKYQILQEEIKELIGFYG